MSANCGTRVDLQAKESMSKDTPQTRQQAENEAKLRQMMEWVKRDAPMRAHMGLDPLKKTGDVKHEFANWVVHKLGYAVDPRRNLLSTQDINFLYAEMLRGRDVMARAGKWANKDQMHAWINKVLFLPQDVWRRDVLGGEDYFLETQVLRSERDGKMSRYATELVGIEKRLTEVMDVEHDAVLKVLEPLERDLGRARQDLRELEEAPTKNKKAILEAKLAVDSAKAAYDKAMRGDYEDPKIARGLRALRTIAKMLDGVYIHTDSMGTETQRKIKVKTVQVGERMVDSGLKDSKGKPLPPMPEWIYERRLDKDQMSAILGEVMGKSAGKQTEAIVNDIADFLNRFSEVARSGFKAERDNMIYTLMRGEARMTRAEATRTVDNAMDLKMEDIYFPRQSMEAKARLERMAMEVQTASDKRSLLEKAAEDKDMFTLPGESTPSVLPRKYGQAPSDTSHNVIGSLSSYGTKMINYWHNNNLHLMSNRLLDRLWRTHRAIKDPAEAKQFEQYVDGVTKYVADFVDRSKNSAQGGKMHEVMKILVGWKAGLTMGFLNPSTPLLNLAEGQALIMTRAGRHYFHGEEKQNAWQELTRDYDIGREYTNISESQIMGTGDTPILDGRGPTNLSKEQRKLYSLVEIDTNKRFLSMLSGAVSEVAKKAIVLQRKAENANRSRAFRTGALMEYEFLQGFKSAFMDAKSDAKHLVTEKEMEMLGLTHADFATEGSRKAAWRKLVKSRVTKAGFEMVYQTQWNYNQVARHVFERQPIGKIAMMFQHYPLSWLSALRRNFEILNSLRRAGSFGGSQREGVKAMVAPTSRDGQLSPLGRIPVNGEAMFALVAGGIALTLAGIRNSTGLVMGQMFQHPLSESVEDMVKYVKYGFEGRHEQKKSLFWSKGLVNNFTGPLYGDLMDAISLGALKAGIEDGDMPRWTADLLRGTVGFRPNELLLTEYGRRNFSNAWDVMYETFLFGGASVTPKAARLAKATPGIGEWITGRPATLKDLSYQIVRAAGVRDERSVEGAIKRRLEKEPKT